VAHAYEMVDSDLGPVLEVALITDFDGKVSLSLKEYVWQHGLTPECEAALEEFWQQLDKHWVFVEARPDNLSVQGKSGWKVSNLRNRWLCLWPVDSIGKMVPKGAKKGFSKTAEETRLRIE
jgi:hypothetical protein